MGEIDISKMPNYGDGDDDFGSEYFYFTVTVVDNGYLLEFNETKEVFQSKDLLHYRLGELL